MPANAAEEAVEFLAGVRLEDLAARYGTPFYLYDADAILARVHRINSGLNYRPLKLFYSAKANAAVAIAALVREAGVGLDACSPGDLRLAELAGFDPRDVSYTSFGATREEMTDAARRCGTLVVDRIDDLPLVAEIGVARIGLRVNPAISAGFHRHVMAGSSQAKFGIALSELERACSVAGGLGVEVCGFHAHLGSDIIDPRPHAQLLKLLASKARLWPASWINLGGGWGTPRRAGDGEYDWSALEAVAHRELGDMYGNGVELRLEPGAYLTMDAGVIVTRVLATQRASAERPPTLVTDANTNHVISALIYGAHHPISPVRDDSAICPETYRVAGNLMQAGDILADEVKISTVHEGDLLVIGHVGAYAASRAGVFNERPRPAEVLIRDGVPRLIRRAETVDELFARDVPLDVGPILI